MLLRKNYDNAFLLRDAHIVQRLYSRNVQKVMSVGRHATRRDGYAIFPLRDSRSGKIASRLTVAYILQLAHTASGGGLAL